MGRRINPVYAELRKELRRLARFLQVRISSNVSTEPFAIHKRLGYAQSVPLEDLSKMAGTLLSLLPETPCECGRLPHLENCNRVLALEWETEFYNRWGLVRKSNTEQVPEELKEKAGQHEKASSRDPSVIPLRRSG